MRILPLAPQNSRNLSFRRRLTIAEELEMQEVNAQAKKLLGNTGNSVLVVHDACMPQATNVNTGVGNLLSEDADKFFDFAKTYFGINTIQVHPQGEYINRPRKNNLVCPYSYSAFGLNESLIDLETLTKDSWRNILKPEELAQIVDANSSDNNKYLTNYENINEPDNAFHTNIRKAFERFQKLDKNDELKINFEKFKAENKDWLEPKILYAYLHQKNGNNHHRFWKHGVDTGLYDHKTYKEKLLKARREHYLAECKDEAEFYSFKQFVADSHLAQARENLHKKGLKLFGDMEINFAQDEIWANPRAFLLSHHIGANDWKAPSLNYFELADENSEAAKHLKRKVEFMAKRYDGIRFDASWMYITPALQHTSSKRAEYVNLGDKVLKMMEDEVKRVQGDAFNPDNLIHEFKAGSEFSMLQDGKVRPEIANRITILESEYMSDSWGSFDYFHNRLNWSKDTCIMGVGDHTAQPLVQMALGMEDSVEFAKSGINVRKRDIQAPILAQMFSDTVENLSKPANFINAKFADIMSAKHNFVFFMDALGRSVRFDSQGLNNHDNYRYKISTDFMGDFHKALQRGHALNLSAALAKAMEKAGLKDVHKDLYDKLMKFAQILKEKDGENVVEEVSQKAGKFSLKKAGIIGTGILALVSLGGVAVHKSRKSEA